MKKILLIVLFILLTSLITASTNLPYAKKCVKCVEYRKKYRTGDISLMWRDFGTPNKYENGHIYTLYKCYCGHKVWVQIDD